MKKDTPVMPSIVELKLQELFDNTNEKYVIPRYQREFAWEDDQVSQLMRDLWSAYKSDSCRYYLGSLVVFRNEDNQLETIDGQQRLTALSLLFGLMGRFRKSPIITFYTRNDCNAFLDRFCQSGKAIEEDEENDKLKSFLRAIKCMRNCSYSEENGKESIIPLDDEEFQKFVLSRTILFQVEMPPETDAMAYFEVMNNRGKQLEEHELLKAKLLGHLHAMREFPNGATYSKLSFRFNQIWTACANMNGHLIDHLHACYVFRDKPDCDWTSKEFSENSSGDIDETDVPYERQSVIRDFSQFLMHVIRLYFDPDTKIRGNRTISRKVPLDERKLKEFLDVEFNPIEFLDLLIRTRLAFDRYVVKSKMKNGEVEKWQLREIRKSVDSSYYPKNTFDDANIHERILRLQSALQVSNADQRYKEWVYLILKMSETDRSNANKLLEDLESFAADRIRDSQNDSRHTDYYAQGLQTPRLLFNLIDYLMWLESENSSSKNRADSSSLMFDVPGAFVFTYQNSIEHHNPRDEKYCTGSWKSKDADVDDIGNLYLVSSSENSSMSNHSPKEKVDRYASQKRAYCPKRWWMYERTKQTGWTWNDAEELSGYVRRLVDEFLEKRK